METSPPLRFALVQEASQAVHVELESQGKLGRGPEPEAGLSPDRAKWERPSGSRLQRLYASQKEDAHMSQTAKTTHLFD